METDSMSSQRHQIPMVLVQGDTEQKGPMTAMWMVVVPVLGCSPALRGRGWEAEFKVAPETPTPAAHAPYSSLHLSVDAVPQLQSAVGGVADPHPECVCVNLPSFPVPCAF